VTLAEALAENAMLRTVVAQLMAKVKQLEARIVELEARPAQNSQNSSRPPSSDPPSLKLPPKKRPSGRKPGGQPGHKGSHRELLPAEKVNKVEEHWPTSCENCEAVLRTEMRTEVGEPLRHQVAKIPLVQAYVREHRMHARACHLCQHATQAERPAGVPTGAFGPRLQAVIALLTGCYNVSKRTAMSALGDLFRTVLSLGSVSKSEQVMSNTVGAPVTEAHEYVQKQPVVHADETSSTERHQRAWLWIAGTPYVPQDSRGRVRHVDFRLRGGRRAHE